MEFNKVDMKEAKKAVRRRSRIKERSSQRRKKARRPWMRRLRSTSNSAGFAFSTTSQVQEIHWGLRSIG